MPGDWRAFLPDRSYFREFLPVFAGVFSEQGFERIGMVLYTRMVAELGTAAYAVHAICMNFCDFYYCFAGGLGKANMVMAGHAHGAGDWAYWQRQLRSGLKWSLIFSLVSFVLTFSLREEIFSLYSHEVGLLPLGSLVMIFVAAVSFPEAHALVCAGVLRGSGRTSQVAAYSFVSIAFLRPLITAFFLQVMDMGLPGAWLALAIDQSIRAACASFLLWRLWQRRPQPVCEP
jgi:Na+-driven multidrug efflux pump